MDISSDEKVSKNTQLELIETKPNTNDLDSPYGLDHIFNLDDLPMEDKHVNETPSNPQVHPESHIHITWDPSPLASILEANDPYDSESQVFTFDISLFNIDDCMPLVHPNLID